MPPRAKAAFTRARMIRGGSIFCLYQIVRSGDETPAKNRKTARAPVVLADGSGRRSGLGCESDAAGLRSPGTADADWSADFG